MQCPKCQFENPEGIKFCGECGAKLERICLSCNSPNPPQFKFCGECGHKLNIPVTKPPRDLSFDKKIEKIQKYLPKGLTEKILSQKDRIEGERKHVTVMFCDMEGFTHLAEKLGPEEAYNIMDQVYELLIHKVHEYEGTVNEMTGDGIMALFGAPIALEDAPQRAIRSSWAIHQELHKFNEIVKQKIEHIPPIKMRIGIHTGSVVVGTLGNDLRVEFKAVGDTVNLASRIEELAEPGTTYVTEDTFKKSEGLFQFEALGAKTIKGKEKPINVYQVISPSSLKTQFDVSAERGLTPFIGRERELELLLDGFEQAKEGHGQAFSIVSEAGIGKSRLLYEFRKKILSEDVEFLEGKCLSYGRNIAYHPIVDILKAYFDIKGGDTDIEIKRKVENDLKILGKHEASTIPYILELLSVKDSGIEKISMSLEAKRDRTMEAVKRIFLKASEIMPLVIATEDLHWIDKSSEDFLKHLLDSISGTRIFLLLTYRPEYIHIWGTKSYLNQVNLNRLSNRESLALVSHLLDTAILEEDVEKLILEKTEGIPFFIEEFVKSLVQLKIIVRENDHFRLAKDIQELTIPATIQDVIMARVDALPEGAKEVLQKGSVIEREFRYELIKLVTGFPERILLTYLSVLRDSELIFERGIHPETTYIFKHALTREVVYDSMLSRTKKIIHEQVGNAIEDHYIGNIEEYYGVLAEHFIQSENYEKGANYTKLASRKARIAASFNEAITYGEKRAICLERLPRTEKIEKELIDARVTVGLYYNQMNHMVKAKEAVEPIVDLAFKSDYKKRIAQIYTILGTYNFAVEGDYPNGIKNLKDALEIATELNDFANLTVANHWIGHAYSDCCEFERAQYHLENSLKINEAAKVLWGISIMKSCIAMTVFNNQGKIESGYQSSQEGLRIAEESGDSLSKAEAFTFHGCSCFHKGFMEEAEAHLLKGCNYSDRIYYFAMGAIANEYLGKIYFERGEYQKAIKYYDKANLPLEQFGVWPSWQKTNEIAKARAKVMNNEKDINLELLFKYRNENKQKSNDGVMCRYIAEIILNNDDRNTNEAIDWIDEAIETNKKNGTMWHLGRDYALYANFYKRQGDPVKARENLSKSIGIFKECGAEGWVKKYEKEFVEL